MRFLVFSFVFLASLAAEVRGEEPSALAGNSAILIPDSGSGDEHLGYTRERFGKNMERLAATPRPIKLVFDGDSITDFWQGYGCEVWAKNFADRHGFVFGVSGDRTQHVLWRLNEGQVDGLDPQLVVLMIGTNNLGVNSAKQIAEGIEAIVAAYRKLTPNAVILLQGIFPRAQNPQDPARAEIKRINQLISSLGDGQKVIYLDFGDKFLEPDRTISAEVMPDFLHPSAKGYEIWAAEIKQVVDKYCPAD